MIIITITKTSQLNVLINNQRIPLIYQQIKALIIFN